MSLWSQAKIFLHSAFSTQSVSLQDFSSHSKTSGSSGKKLNEKSTYLKSEEKWLFETGACAAPQAVLVEEQEWGQHSEKKLA